jgi:hypothetical protein
MQIEWRRISSGLYIASLTFFTYTSVYAFRKPFTVAGFEGESYLGLNYQTLLIISQVIGYMLSKFAGIRVISSLKRTERWRSSAVLMFSAWASLFLFAIMPKWMGPLFFLINGFALGFMWGIVFSYAEGRRSTDMIGSVLAISFIFAGGFTRSVAKWLMVDYGVSAYWMPFMTGLVFIVPLIVFFYLLEKAPMPDQGDKIERVERVSMTAADRSLVFSKFRVGLIIIAIGYGLLTVIRDIRDNYMGNMWRELGYEQSASVFTRSETRISIILLFVMALLVLVRRNIKAFLIIHGVISFGFIVAGVSSFLFITGSLDGAIWMQLVGLGLYMAYIPYNALFFERMIATFRIKGNVGFLMYFIDAFGYLGTVVIMLSKEFWKVDVQWSRFYSEIVVVFSIVGLLGTIFSFLYFMKKYQTN